MPCRRLLRDHRRQGTAGKTPLEPALDNGALVLVDTLGDPDDGIACNFTRG